MTRRRMVFLSALAVFTASFFVTAVHSTDSFHFELYGYQCALVTLIALLAPWSKHALHELSSDPVGYTIVLFSGIINPLFIAALASLHTKRRHRPGKLLRIIVIGLFPACWIDFCRDGWHPSAGYFLWTAAMLVALFAVSPKAQIDSVQPENTELEKPREASASTTFLLLESAEGTAAS